MIETKTYIADNRMIGYVKKGMRWEIFNIMFEKYQESVKDENSKDPEIEYSKIMAKSHIECINRLLEMTENEAKEFDKKIEITKKEAI